MILRRHSGNLSDNEDAGKMYFLQAFLSERKNCDVRIPEHVLDTCVDRPEGVDPGDQTVYLGNLAKSCQWCGSFL